MGYGLLLAAEQVAEHLVDDFRNITGDKLPQYINRFIRQTILELPILLESHDKPEQDRGLPRSLFFIAAYRILVPWNARGPGFVLLLLIFRLRRKLGHREEPALQAGIFLNRG